jgi:UDP-glucose 4-epimerase
MRVLVTGGAGFIGSHMADRLLRDGNEVVVLDNESTGSRDNVPAAARYIRGDVSVPADVARAFAGGLDAVLHIAGQASTIRSFDDPTDDLRTNVQGTICVLRHCIAHRVGRLLYASSMTAYGHPAELPVAEDLPLAPVSYYGVSKMAAERYVHATAARNDLDFELHATSFRMFNVYGERQSLQNPYQGVVAIFIANMLRGEPITIFGDGEQSRDFVHIDDVVEAWMAALGDPAAHEQVYNLGTGTRRTVHDLIDATLASRGLTRADYDIRYDRERPGDQRHMEADISRIGGALGWRPRVGFEEGMARTVRWAEGRA